MYTISQRQQIKNRLADSQHFKRDRDLFVSYFPHHPLQRELVRVNSVNCLRLSRQMIYLLLSRVSEEQIISNRKSERAANRSFPESPANRESPANSENPASPATPEIPANPATPEIPANPAKTPKRSKQDEFPCIDWTDNLNPDIQLCILLYDDRVNTYHRLQELDRVADTQPSVAKEMALLDERNRQAQRELEVFAQTRVFPAEHPIAAKFLAEQKKRKEYIQLKHDNPEQFTRLVTNLTQNIRRVKSRINKHHYKSDDELKRWQGNLDANIQTLQMLQDILKSEE